MSDDARDLGRLQRWMLSVIMHPGGVVEGAGTPQAREQVDATEGIETIINASQALTSVERLEIYARAYYARLIECLQAEYPVLVETMGSELFDQFALGYLESYPSQSYTLNWLGQHFAVYLRDTRPPRDGEDLDWADFLADLAAFEWTINQVFDGPGAEGAPLLSASQLATIPDDQWPRLRLVAAPCLQLLRVRFPVHAFYRAMRQQRETQHNSQLEASDAAVSDMPWPDPADTHLAVTRRNYVVRHYEISAAQHALLSAIIAGQPLVGAVATAVELAAGDAASFAASLDGWFRDWAAEGFFLTVASADAASNS